MRSSMMNLNGNNHIVSNQIPINNYRPSFDKPRIIPQVLRQ